MTADERTALAVMLPLCLARFLLVAIEAVGFLLALRRDRRERGERVR